MEYMNGHPMKVTRVEAENEVEVESDSSDYEAEPEVVNVREEGIEYMNGHPVVITKVEDEAEGADVEEKRARSEDNDGGRQRIAVENQAPRRILNRGEPMDMDVDVGIDFDKPKDKAGRALEGTSGGTKDDNKPHRTLDTGKDASKDSDSVGKHKPNPTAKQQTDITKVNKILDGTVPTQWLRVKGVPLLKREGHRNGGGTWERSWEYHADDWGNKRHDVDFDAYPWASVASRVAGIVTWVNALCFFFLHARLLSHFIVLPLLLYILFWTIQASSGGGFFCIWWA